MNYTDNEFKAFLCAFVNKYGSVRKPTEAEFEAFLMGVSYAGDSDNSYQDGYDDGYQDGYDDGYDDGYRDGYRDGYDDGYRDGKSEVDADEV